MCNGCTTGAICDLQVTVGMHVQHNLHFGAAELPQKWLYANCSRSVPVSSWSTLIFMTVGRTAFHENPYNYGKKISPLRDPLIYALP
jgi:hypothetical protein